MSKTNQPNNQSNCSKRCYNCGETKLGNSILLRTNLGYEPIWCCDDCYVDWYLK